MNEKFRSKRTLTGRQVAFFLKTEEKFSTTQSPPPSPSDNQRKRGLILIHNLNMLYT